mmetsp:Transcript_35177/g.87358  ORF Transcript_35177/g.87358 Transcript_35177/m.87358 type:complete len:215 (-) Transcript_35177:58-702(-)
MRYLSPGPSTAVMDSTEWTRPVTSGICSDDRGVSPCINAASRASSPLLPMTSSMLRSCSSCIISLSALSLPGGPSCGVRNAPCGEWSIVRLLAMPPIEVCEWRVFLDTRISSGAGRIESRWLDRDSREACLTDSGTMSFGRVFSWDGSGSGGMERGGGWWEEWEWGWGRAAVLLFVAGRSSLGQSVRKRHSGLRMTTAPTDRWLGRWWTKYCHQ